MRNDPVPSGFERRLAAAQAGDEGSFAELFRALQPRLLRFLYAIAPGLADDVAAETWLRVVRGLHRFSGGESAWEAWVFTIARARLVDARRKASRSPVPVDAEAALAATPGFVDVAGSVEEMFSTEGALALIGLLPSQQAEVVLLRYVVGMDVGSTAAVLRKRPGAVRVAGHRGLRRLAELLSQRESTDLGSRCNAENAVGGS